MKVIHDAFKDFKEEFPQVYARHAALGEEIHERSGPLDEKCRWLIKVGISAASGHERALETHITKAREAGAGDEEIKQALLLIVPTVGFPTFMEAYSVFRDMG
jgi:4-carboxymuconolactone decarboxylase